MMVSFQILVSCFHFASFTLAAPLERRVHILIGGAYKAVDPAPLASFNLYEQYAAAAYCPNNNDSPNTKLVCAAGNCPLVEGADTNTVIEFQNTAGTDATGYLATDSTNNLIILSFRGSESIRNYFSDLNFVQVPVDICDDCHGDAGFWASWLETRDSVTAAVKMSAAAYPSYKIVTTGHSLGGAIATFAAAELRNQGYTVDLCSFGSPRVGDPATAAYISNQGLGQNYRITHLNDPVPRLPPEAFDYLHTSPEYYITSANGAPVTANDIRVCSGLGNSSCNSAWLVLDINAHAWYFNGISSCYPGDTIEV